MWSTLVGHFYGTLLQDSIEHSCGALLLKSSKINRHISKTSVSYETSSKGHTSRLQNEHFARDFLKNSRFESAKRAFRTRLPPEVTCQSLQKSTSYETSSKSQAGTPIGTCIKQPCQAVSWFQPSSRHGKNLSKPRATNNIK